MNQATGEPFPPPRSSDHVLLFSGHLVDAPGRFDPRFPPSLEYAATKAIERAIAEIGPTLAIASAARGGDILFHEACRARGIQTTIVLPLPVEEFVKQSVSGAAGGHWEERFNTLLSEPGPARIIQLDPADSANPFHQANNVMLDLAKAHDPKPTLLALWNGQYGDGPGGTADMVDAIQRQGGRVVIIEPLSLYEPSQSHN
jgi:hypothetical protein